MDPITLTIIVAGIASALALAKRKPDVLTTKMAAQKGAEAGAKVFQEAAPDATAAAKKAVTKKAVNTAIKVALKAVPIIAAIAAVVVIVKKVKAARQARSAALRQYWPLLSWPEQLDWLHKKTMSRTGKWYKRTPWHRRVKIAEKVNVARGMARSKEGDEAIKARVKENMKDPNWHDTQPPGNRRAWPWTTYPSYQAKQKAKEIELKREAATEAAKATLVQAGSIAGLSLL